MNFGFLLRCDEQGVSFHQIGEGPAGAVEMATTAGDDDCRVVFLGRLYYRDDLRGRLAEERRPEPAACPAAYALAAYRQGGAEGLAWLEGDYALALWDARSRTLLAARDPMGGFPLYWIRDGRAVALSTAMRPLLDRLPGRTVNRDYLAEFVILPGGAVQELYDERCAYEGVHRVLPGTRIEVRCDGTVRPVRWWDWENRVETPASLRLEDLSAQFGFLLDQAVQQRRIGRTAAHFSGGMDSTAVALLAARQAVAAGDEPIHGLSLVYERFAVLSRETPYIESALGGPGLEWHRLPGEKYLSCEDFRSNVNPDEPVYGLWEGTSTRAMVDLAASLGARTLMTGRGGDQVAEPEPYHVYELLRRGHWLKAYQESARWAKSENCSRWRFLGPFGLQFLLPVALRTGFSCWRRRGQVAWEQQHGYTIGPWIRPEFANRFDLWQRVVQRLRRTAHRCRPMVVSMGIEAAELSIGDAVRWELGLPRGLMNVHPFFDPRLICFCLGFHGSLWPEPGRQKPMLADAMRDVLPAAIRQRQRKGHFNEVFYNGLSQNLSMLESLVEKAPADDLDLLDKNEVLRCLHKAALGIGMDAPGTARLGLTLALLKWLTTQAEGLSRPGPQLQPLGPSPYPLPATGPGSSPA